MVPVLERWYILGEWHTGVVKLIETGIQVNFEILEVINCMCMK